MNYLDFLFSQLFMNYCENFKTQYNDLEYDNIFPEILKHKESFLKSEFNTDKLSEYECINNYLNKKVKEFYKVDEDEFLKWYFQDQEEEFLKRTCFDLAKGNTKIEDLFFACECLPSRLIKNYNGKEQRLKISDCRLTK